ncbi:DUF6262 family protein [Mycobacterium sp. AMU20-3851]|uniref:DUF6262 family protein n=1 Tax=Mycobacterium sp. AMU20-3851 TaxID=3122055 RepID=UPI00375402EA
MSRPKPPPPTQKALDALDKYRQGRSDEKRRDIEKAIAYLRKTHADINFSTVSRRAKVSRKTIYKHDDLVTVIEQYRDRPTDREPASTGRETSIDAALRHRLAAKDKEIAALKATVAEQQSTIELLYGQLDTLHEQIT